jgi:parallel beta-helix repeat protein/predicted outer membrane repeat protein
MFKPIPHRLAVALAALCLAGSAWSRPLEVRVIPVPRDLPHRGTEKAAVGDTVVLLGGPGTLEGRFEDGSGQPDLHGWQPVDVSSPPENHWHTDTYGMANLDPAEPENHGWWCGDLFPAPCNEGYGNRWRDNLDWYGTVADPGSSTLVRVTARLNVDMEAGYDWLALQVETAAGFIDIRTWDGDQQGIDVDETYLVSASDYVGAGADQIHLRWRVESDGSFSDEDCLLDTAGAAQLDLVAVYFDQSTGWNLIGSVETCEPGEPLQWTPVIIPGVGCFAKVWPVLDDLDPAADNLTPQLAFIDDGVVVPGTGGTLGETWTYGPGGYVVNNTGGLSEPEGTLLHNLVASPILAWPEGDYDCLLLEYDVYAHLPLNGAGCVVYGVVARSTTDPSGAAGWTDWRATGLVYFSDEPQYLRGSRDLFSLLEPGPKFVQVGFTVLELLNHAIDPTPGPYFDNVAIKACKSGPPILYVDQDAPGLGDGSSWEDAYVDLRDALNGLPDDGSEWQVWVAEGTYTPLSSDRGASFTLRSNLWLYGGFAGDETRLGQRDPDAHPSILSGDIGIAGDPTDNSYHVVMAQGGTGNQVLDGFVVRDGYADGATVDSFGGGLYVDQCSPTIANVNFTQNVANSGAGMFCYGNSHPRLTDVTFSQNSAGNQGGGLFVSNTSSTEQVNVIYHGNSAYFYGGGFCERGDGSTLTNVLFLENTCSNTGGGMYVAGSSNTTLINATIWGNTGGIAGGIANLSAGVVSIANTIIWGNTGGPWPEIYNSSGLPVISHSLIGGCGGSGGGWVPTFGIDDGGNLDEDPLLVNPAGGDLHLSSESPVIGMGDDGAIPSGVVSDLDGNPRIVGTSVDMGAFEWDGVSSVEDVPGQPRRSMLRNAVPNPFNPQTRISFGLQRETTVSLQVFDIAGRLVRVLIDGEVRDRGNHEIVWDGRDDNGNQMASGIYVCRLAAGGITETNKMMLVK